MYEIPRIHPDVTPVIFPTHSVFNPREPRLRVKTTQIKTTIRRTHMQVIILTAQGLSREEIASRMCISPHTVATHMRRIFATLNVQTSAQMVHIAYQLGLLVPTHTHLLDEASRMNTETLSFADVPCSRDDNDEKDGDDDVNT